MANYCERTLRRKAERIGYRLEKGYQKYFGGEWGFFTDSQGNKITGYSLYNPEGIDVNAPYSSTACHDHQMTLDEVETYLKEAYEEMGLLW